MAVGGPLVISSNAALVKYRPFSSCFNLSPLLQRYIRAAVHRLFVCIQYFRLAMSAAYAWIHFLFTTHEHKHMQRGYSASTCTETKDMPETGTLGGDDMHCLFNHVLWDDSVIMLSSARFSTAELGCYSMPRSSLTIPHFERLRRSKKARFLSCSLSSLFPISSQTTPCQD